MRSAATAFALLLTCALSAWGQAGPTQRCADPGDYRLEPLRSKAAPEAFDEDKRGPTGFIALRLSAQCAVDNAAPPGPGPVEDLEHLYTLTLPRDLVESGRAVRRTLRHAAPQRATFILMLWTDAVLWNRCHSEGDRRP